MSDPIILVVDDEPSIGEVVTIYLQRAGYQVNVARDGQAALEAIEQHPPDLVVLDLMLPKVDGLEIARRVRAQGDTPIIMLTARREESDRITGLETGADDYVVKPFSPQELVSRVKAVLRRTRGPASGSTERAIEFADMHIDPKMHLVVVRGKDESLTAIEFDLLWLLARHPRQVFSREQLLDLVWGMTEYVDPSTVTVHMRRLREKIEIDPSNPRHLQTVWGVGYKFEP